MKTARGKRLHEASLQWMRREAATDRSGGNPQHWWEPWPEDDSGRSTDWDTATRVRMHCCMTQQQVIKSAVEVIAASSPWFIRPRLEATAMERLDPVGLVRSWVDDASDLLEGVHADDPEDEAWRYMAIYGRLLRARPEILDEAEADHPSKQATKVFQVFQVFHERKTEFLEVAMESATPLQWIEAAEKLAASYDGHPDPLETTRTAAELVEQFDDAAILRALAGESWSQVAGLEAEWQQAYAWLCQNADTFLAASAYIQTIASTFRDDLSQSLPGLAETTDAFVRLLEAIEAFEVESRYENLEPLTADQIIACLGG